MRAGAYLVLLSVIALACQPSDPRPHGIVLIVLDTLRADGLASYGNPRATSPRIDQLAAGGVQFDQVVSHAPWTLPGFVGLLSGSYPSARVFEQRLQRSLVEDLAAAGYATAAFTEGAYVSEFFGIDRGFAVFRAEQGDNRLGGPAFAAHERDDGDVESTFDHAIAWLRAHADRRFFLMVHTYEVHMPYDRLDFARALPSGALPEIYSFEALTRVTDGTLPVGETERRYARALYDGGVAVADHQVGRLLDALEELGIADRTLVVLTSDHGEELGERAPQRLGVHGRALYDTLLRIPLILRFPAREFSEHRIATQVRLIDVMPTILDLAGVAVPEDADGASLLPLLLGRERADRTAYAELTAGRTSVVRTIALRDGRFKLIVNAPPLAPGEIPAELYDLSNDPGERENRAASEPARKDELLARIQAQRATLDRGDRPPSDPAEVPSELRDRLRALGYAD